ncbi:hypothetical protein HPB47_015769 [Ixodes persulcatus]|uniref:Uncharacterized protein n=1 Tax=Ixodes persulcatus TaxID=34615 RepID=A0AC60QW70_IXOPE|nr:hypothetical protein HPB47_015769 [Ixodes persulcatus]
MATSSAEDPQEDKGDRNGGSAGDGHDDMWDEFCKNFVASSCSSSTHKKCSWRRPLPTIKVPSGEEEITDADMSRGANSGSDVVWLEAARIKIPFIEFTQIGETGSLGGVVALLTLNFVAMGSGLQGGETTLGRASVGGLAEEGSRCPRSDGQDDDGRGGHGWDLVLPFLGQETKFGGLTSGTTASSCFGFFDEG